MGEIKQQTISGVKWSAIERFSNQGITFVLGLIMARLLTPTDYGTIGMLGIFIAIAQTFIDSGFSNALVRKIDRTEKDLNTVFYFNIVVSIVCFGILFLIAPAVANFFHQPILKSVLRVISINLVIQSFNSVQSALFQINVDFKTIAKCTLTSTIISGILGVTLAWLGFGVWALVFQQICATTVRTLSIWILSKWRPRRIFSWASFKELFSYGSKLLAAGLLHTLYTNLTSLLIGRFYTAKDLGFYTRGDQLPSLVCSNTTGIFQRVTFPIFAKLQNDKERLIAVYRKYICITSMVIFFVMFLLFALSKPLILFLLGAKWESAVLFCQILCFAWMFDHICIINLNLLQVEGRSDLFLKLEIIKKSISLAMICAAVPFGVMAICISRVLYSQIAVYINTFYTGRIFGVGYVSQFRDFGKYLIWSAIAAAPAYLLTFTSLPNLVTLSAGSIIAVSIYILILNITHDRNWNELSGMAAAKYPFLAFLNRQTQTPSE